MFDHLKKTISEGRKRIAALEAESERLDHEREERRRAKRREVLRRDETAWQKVQQKLDAVMKRWKDK